MKICLALTASALTVLGLSAANAAIVLSDNFDSDNVTLNWVGDTIFVPPNAPVLGMPSVDLVGAADGFASLAFDNGVSVDLAGSTGVAGILQSVATLAAGDYTVTFLLAGNLRGAVNKTTQVGIGSQFVTITPVSNSQGYTLYTENFTNASGRVTFRDIGGTDDQGNLLDNIVVSTGVTAGVPEPATWAMMLAGFGVIGFVVRRKKQTALAI
ncbi:MAG TPA: PEPxxWA-CTERM sorting domain-containing protein [Rhizomicrobium sp.]|jgi:hypothetical protein|nr:PEPxxWA-CTERM sorting domain-containing protein [Rhizomicrobium sp.]